MPNAPCHAVINRTSSERQRMLQELCKRALLFKNLVERDLGRFLRHVDILVECAIRSVLLFFDRRAKLQQFFWDRLVRSIEDVDKPVNSVSLFHGGEDHGKHLRSRISLIMLSEQGDGKAILPCSPGSTDSVDIVLCSQGKRHIDDDLDCWDV